MRAPVPSLRYRGTHRRTGRIPLAELLALNAVAQTLVPTPGAGQALLLHGIHFHKPAGPIFDAAANEDIAVRIENKNGTEVGRVEVTGFLTVSTVQSRHERPTEQNTALKANVPLVAHMSNGEIVVDAASAWAANTNYAVGNIRTHSNKFWRRLVAGQDTAAQNPPANPGDWEELSAEETGLAYEVWYDVIDIPPVVA